MNDGDKKEIEKQLKEAITSLQTVAQSLYNILCIVEPDCPPLQELSNQQEVETVE